MYIAKALPIAQKVKLLLAPYCERIEIAGSIRRSRPQIKDIEIVAIPKPYEIGLFKDGIAAITDEWEYMKGKWENKDTKYIQRMLPEGIVLDLFLCDTTNWGLIYCMRTGSADWNRTVLFPALNQHGFTSKGGYLRKEKDINKILATPEEINVFQYAQLEYLHPSKREVNASGKNPYARQGYLTK